MFLQEYALLLDENSIYTSNVYHDEAPICIAMLVWMHLGQRSLEHPQNLACRIASCSVQFAIVPTYSCCPVAAYDMPTVPNNMGTLGKGTR